VAANPPGQAYYRLLLAESLKLLTDSKSASQAIKTLLPGGVIGMKTNCLTPRLTNTPTAMTAALGDLLTEAGIKENNLVVWERSNRELRQAGYELNASSFGRRCLGTDSNGVGYSSEHYSYERVHSRITRILLDLIDSNINLPVLKDHSIAGLSGALKNMFGAIHNPNKYHGNNCDPYAAYVSSLEPIKRKNKLTITNAVRVQYDGGPGLRPERMAGYGALIVSADPVAADTVGLKIVEHFREMNGLPPLAKTGRSVTYLETAAKVGLGKATLDDLDLRIATVNKDGSMTEGSLL
jgi:uncharacterized protein (DUF362 family)